MNSLKKHIMVFIVVNVLFAGRIVCAEQFTYDDKDQRDPFWPLVGPSGLIITYDTDFMITDLILEGTMSAADGQGIAIINGKVLRVNDSLGQFTVKDIETNSVTLMKGEKKFILKLKKEE